MKNPDKPILVLTRKDFEFQYFRSGGPGGQNQNKVASGVRIIHKPSGCSAECRETRSQLENKQRAFKRLTNDPKFRLWLKIESLGRLGDIEARVDEEMKNILIEYYTP